MPRRGRPSVNEMQFISDNSEKLSVAEIASALDRTPEFIQNVVGIPITDDNQTRAVKRELRDTVEWRELKKQFTKEQLNYFSDRWTTWMEQFKGDMLPSEETQVFMLLKTEMLVNKNLEDKQKIETDILKLQTIKDSIYARYNETDKMDDDDTKKVISINEQLTAMQAGQQARTTEYLKLMEMCNDHMKQLKATRDQRLKRVTDSKIFWVDTVKELMEEEPRRKAGQQAELMAMAAEKERDRLTNLHQYIDGNLDRPFLNSESILKE